MKNLWKPSLVAGSLLGLVVAAVAVRSSRSAPLTTAPGRAAARAAAAPTDRPAIVIVPPPKFVPAAPDRLAAAMNDSTLTTMVDNYLVAAARNDPATREAMLSGLKRQPLKSAEMLAARRQGMDPGSALAVDRALQELQVIK